MEIMKLKENQHVQLRVTSGQRKGIYDSRVEAINDSHIIVGMPIQKHSLIFLKEGTKIEVNYIYLKMPYGFIAEIERALTEPLPLLILKKPENHFKVQRRDFVRIEAILSVDYYIENEGEQKEPCVLHVSSRDIGGGGIAIIEKQVIPINTILNLNIHLPEGNLEIKGKVVRWGEIDTSSTTKYWMGIEFINILERERQKIIHYIFKRQRELRNRGLL